MGCIYSDFDGNCTEHDGDIDEGLGCDEDGNCEVESDEDPGQSCNSYESDE